MQSLVPWGMRDVGYIEQLLEVVCVGACAWQREREGGRETEKEREKREMATLGAARQMVDGSCESMDDRSGVLFIRVCSSNIHFWLPVHTHKQLRPGGCEQPQ